MTNIITLKDRKILGNNNIGMWFDRKGSDFTFEPGQYAKITLLEPIYNDEQGNSRLFSLASSPKKDYVMFTTRALDSAFNKNILEMPIGAKAEIDGFGGNTALHKDTSVPAVFLIGGIGITPVRCMVEYIVTEKLPYKAYLFYSNPDAASMAFFEDFENWAKEYDGFKFLPFIDDRENKNWKYDFGYINKDAILNNIPDITKPVYYIVGPLVMVEAMEKILLELNVNPGNIKLEKFG
ncbi:MAG: FAD-dependent oxidoreductase [Bacteroidetes bacterium]|nr:FAD-dependent oxidoreductase [Bacteroidota bacterium]